MSIRNIKCVTVGDPTVGKTCMLRSYAEGHFPIDYVPTGICDRNIYIYIYIYIYKLEIQSS